MRDVLDFERPIALMLFAVVHFIKDDDESRAIIRRLVDALPSGSYVAMLHFSTDTLPPDLAADHRRVPRPGRRTRSPGPGIRSPSSSPAWN